MEVNECDYVNELTAILSNETEWLNNPSEKDLRKRTGLQTTATLEELKGAGLITTQEQENLRSTGYFSLQIRRISQDL